VSFCWVGTFLHQHLHSEKEKTIQLTLRAGLNLDLNSNYTWRNGCGDSHFSECGAIDAIESVDQIVDLQPLVTVVLLYCQNRIKIEHLGPELTSTGELSIVF